MYDPNFPDAQPWYEANHSGEEIVPEIDVDTDTTLQTEGVSNSWYYSVLSNDSSKRAELPTVETVRTPVIYDNTAEARMRGDFAVPTLFNGNFDAISNRMVDQVIPGWSLHGGSDSLLQSALVDVRNTSGASVYSNNAPNYALRLGEETRTATHNWFVMPDWGNLRFDIHAPDSLGTNAKLNIELTDTEGREILYETINLGENAEFSIENGTDVEEIAEQYLNNVYKIGFGRRGFETFQLNMPFPDFFTEKYRGKRTKLTFSLEGGDKETYVDIDNVFFKSAHLQLGNPTEARWNSNEPDESPYKNNLLLEIPQYTVSYNADINAPNWVSWKVDNSWSIPKGGSLNPRPEFISNPDLPDGWKSYINPDGDEIIIDGRLYTGTGMDRGHLIPIRDRNRDDKDKLATFLSTNLIPQSKDNNENFTDDFNPTKASAWYNIEGFVAQAANRGDQVYVIAGAFGNNQNPQKITNVPELIEKDPRNEGDTNPDNFIEANISIPEWTWKTYLVLKPGEEITKDTKILTYLTPNTAEPNEWSTGEPPFEAVSHPFNQLFGGNRTISSPLQWRNPVTWRVSLQQLEDLLNRNVNLEGQKFNFLSNIPEKIRNELKRKNSYPTLSSPLIAEKENNNSFFFKEKALGMESASRFVNEYSIIPSNIALKTGFFTRSTDISPLKVGTNIVSTGRINANPINLTQVTINDSDTFKITPIHTGTPKITKDELSSQKIRTTEIDIAEVNVTQARPTQIDGLEVNPSQVTTVHNNTSQVSLPIFITPKQFWSSNNFNVAGIDTTIRHNGVTKNSPFTDFDITQVGTSQISTSQISTSQIGTSQIGTSQIGTSEVSTIQISSEEIGIAQIGINKKSSGELSSLQIGTSQASIHQATVLDVKPTQINIAQVDINQPRWSKKDSSEISSPKISFPSSIPFKQLFSGNIHNSNSELTNTFQDNPLNITLQVTDLPTGQLAEAQVTHYTDQGIPKVGKILIDHNANGLGWFIDTTPLDHSEFSQTLTDTALLATADSEAHGKYDLLTTILHVREACPKDILGHLAGFISGYNEFDRHIQTINGKKTFVADNFTATLSPDGSHLDSEAHPYDLMNTTLRPGVRKLPSSLNLQILNLLRSGESDPTEAQLTAPLTSTPLLGINNGTFDTQEAWSTRGAANIIQGQAVLTEESRLNSSFTQNFIIPEEAKYLQFTILESDLDTSNLAPGDAFEVALLNNQNLSLAGTPAGLTHTDALLNIQYDDAYFSDKVNISGTETSGNQIDLNVTRTVTIDISHINANTEATLYFDLLGFGDKESRVIIDNVRILTSDILIPTANNDTAIANQGKPVTINILDNDTDPDGTINPSTIQIESAPVNGNITINDDGTITYTPSGNATTDTFTYIVKDNDNNTSNTATVNITINNSAPSIREIIVEPNLAEGIDITVGANAADEGEITYSWNFGDNTPTLNGQSVTHTFLDNGTYTATLTVTDSLGASTVETLTLNVNNIAPTVTAGEDQTTIENQAISFNGNYTDPGILDTHTIKWEFGDGTVVENELNPTHTYTNSGTYTATLTVTDKDGGTSSDTLQVQVNNAAPTITEITGNTNINEGDTATFNAIATSHGDDTLTYTWDFGDGSTTVEGETVNHQFADNGTYTVTLTVENAGGSTQQTLTVNVDNVSPVVEVGDNQITLQGTTVNFDGSFTDPGILDTHTIEWDFGDGNVLRSEGVREGVSEREELLNPTHSYEVPGNYTVTLTVTDSDGASTQDTLIVTVNNAAPVIEELTGDTNINEGDIATFSANATDAGNDNLTYTWDFGDGTDTQQGRNVNQKFVNNGTYIVTLTVTDNDGASTTQTQTVQVNNLAPTVNPGIDQTITEGESITFDGNFSDPGILDTHTIEWDFGDGNTEGGNLNPTHTYTVPGTYTATLTVTDNAGASTQSTLTVQVNNIPPQIIEIPLPQKVYKQDPTDFTATATDPGNQPLTYTWDFGDGTELKTGENVTHTYTESGEYQTTLTVRDSTGASDSETVTVYVGSTPPTQDDENTDFPDWDGDFDDIFNLAPQIKDIPLPDKVYKQDPTDFSANIDNPNNLELTYTWNFGDGTDLKTGENVTHTYTESGEYQTTLTLSDSTGASDSETVTVYVGSTPPIQDDGETDFPDWDGSFDDIFNLAPQIKDIPVPDKVYKQDPTDFSANIDNPNNLELTYTWNFGDGTQLDGENVTHTYAESGTYEATLTLRDSTGASDSETVTVYVGSTPPIQDDRETDFPDWDGDFNDIFNLAPQIKDIPVPDKVYKQDPTDFTANISNPDNQDLTYTWDFGDGTDGVEGKNVTHTYSDSGEYQTTLAIADTVTGEVFDIKQVTVYVGQTAPNQLQDNTDFPDWDGSFDDIFTGLGDEFDEFNW